MNRLTVSLSAVALAVGFAGCAASAHRPTPLPGQETTVSYAQYPCPTVAETFLPGPYYMCEASRDFWSGRQGLSVERLKDSARWGDKQAQFALGVMYFNGDRVAKDRPLGVAWLALASERHDPRIEPVFISAYRQATATERAQADVTWRQLKPVYADAVTAHRAQLRYLRGTAGMRDAADRGGSVYLAGMTPGLDGPGSNFSAFSVLRGLDLQAGTQFEGLNGHVVVGDPALVPLSQIAGPPAKDP